jgi:hypothetical protein
VHSSRPGAFLALGLLGFSGYLLGLVLNGFDLGAPPQMGGLATSRRLRRAIDGSAFLPYYRYFNTYHVWTTIYIFKLIEMQYFVLFTQGYNVLVPHLITTHVGLCACEIMH